MSKFCLSIKSFCSNQLEVSSKCAKYIDLFNLLWKFYLLPFAGVVSFAAIIKASCNARLKLRDAPITAAKERITGVVLKLGEEKSLLIIIFFFHKSSQF